MKVVSWTRKFSVSKSTSPARTRLRKSVSSLTRLLSPGLRRERRRERCVLLPLRITLERPCELVVEDRSHIRLLLQQRVSQRLRDRSRAAVIREARSQLQTDNVQEDVYVPFDFTMERKLLRHNIQELEEELYMTMS